MRAQCFYTVVSSFLFCCFPALAEHTVRSRGVIILPESRSVLLEVSHSFPISTSGFMVTTRLSKEGEAFEDQTIKGAHVQFEVLKIDSRNGNVILRDDGKETVCPLGETQNFAGTSNWFGICLKEARFKDVLSIYSNFKNRTLLVHPRITEGAATLQGTANDKAGAATVFESYFRERGIAAVEEGDTFVLLVPVEMEKQAVPHFQQPDKSSPPVVGALSLSSTLREALGVYEQIFQKRLIKAPSGNPLFVLDTKRVSKPELQYAFDTILRWHDFRIVSTNDATFEVVYEPKVDR